MANSVPSREYQLIESIREECGVSDNRWIKGIGDDCAVRKASEAPLLISADTMVENVHFKLEYMSLAEVGFKAVSGSVSDIYAMGGVAESILIQLVFPKSDKSSEQIKEMYQGIGEAVALFGTPVVGGDIASGPCWIVGVTVLGDARKKTHFRSGAKAGDSIWVTGTPGLSGLGLDLLLSRGRAEAERIDNEAIQAHVRPVPRYSLDELYGNPLITSMIDISDGVGKEVLTICKESCVGAEVECPATIRKRLMAHFSGISDVRSADDLFLSGGEDYELLFTASPEFVGSSDLFTKIGVIQESTEANFVTSNNERILLQGGFDHL